MMRQVVVVQCRIDEYIRDKDYEDAHREWQVILHKCTKKYPDGSEAIIPECVAKHVYEFCKKFPRYCYHYNLYEQFKPYMR